MFKNVISISRIFFESDICPGDYLYAEALGYRADEWRILFVPEILGSRDLLSKNITILTGARDLATKGLMTNLYPFLIVSGLTIIALSITWILYRISLPIIIERMSA